MRVGEPVIYGRLLFLSELELHVDFTANLENPDYDVVAAYWVADDGYKLFYGGFEYLVKMNSAHFNYINFMVISKEEIVDV